MKGIACCLFIVLFSIFSRAQVGVNTSNPEALLDISVADMANPSVTDGILIPRMNTFPAISPGNQQDGMLIFLAEEIQITNASLEIITYSRGFYFWNHFELAWEKIRSNKNKNFQVLGTLETPQSIEDDIFRMGIISVGEQENAAQMSIFVNADTDNLTGKPRKTLYVVNSHPSSGASYHTFGIDVENESNVNGKTYGVRIKNNTATDTMKYGLYNVVSSAGDGMHFGIYNETNQGSTSLNNIYGLYNTVGKTHGAESSNYGIYSEIGGNTSAGTVYGVYSKAEGTSASDVYAGYFLGRVSIGSVSNGVDQGDNYTLPETRGTEGQIMVAGIDGEINWKAENTSSFLTISIPTTILTVTSAMSTIRIMADVTNIVFPDPVLFYGKTFTLIATNGISSSGLNVINSSLILDAVTNVNVTQIISGQKMILQSDGTNWIVIGD